MTASPKTTAERNLAGTPQSTAAPYSVAQGPVINAEEAAWPNKSNEAVDPDAPETRFKAVPRVELSRGRFIVTVVISVAVLVTLLAVFVEGVVIDSGMLDALGSSKNVEERIEILQTVNGFITAGVGNVMENYFEVITVVMTTFLANVRWYPRDQPNGKPNRFKRLCLWAFKPWIMFVLNVAITATFVSHTTTGVVRVFLHDDLVATKAMGTSSFNSTVVASFTTLGNNRSVLDTILRGAVRREIAPFRMLTDSPCGLSNMTAVAGEDDDDHNQPPQLPSIMEVRSTAVVYGFPLQDWNLDAMPFGLIPQHTVTFRLGEISDTDSEVASQLEAFQKASNVSWLTAYEMLLQGKLLFERAVSDSNVSASYPCVWVDGQILAKADTNDVNDDGSQPATTTAAPTAKPPLNQTTTRPPPSNTTLSPSRGRRSLQTVASNTTGSGDDDKDLESYLDKFEDGPYKGMRRCYGALSSLQALTNMTDTSMHNADAFLGTMVDGFIDTVPQIEPESMDLTFSTFAVGPQMTLTAMTLDMPYYENTTYRNTSEYCNGDVLTPQTRTALESVKDATPEEMEVVTRMLCDQSSYPYLRPREACGHASCVFLDKSRTIPFKKQLQLMPYLTNCSTAQLKYNGDFLNFFPTGCVAQENAVFLYGLGSYMTGDRFDSGDDEAFPFIINPRRHVMLSFAKLEWKVEDLSHKFDAACDVNATMGESQCQGLLYPLENVTVPALNANETSSRHDKYVRMLVLGKDHLPADRTGRDYRDPVQLVSLNTRPFYYAKDNANYEWEYIQKGRFNKSTWSTTAASKDGSKPTGGLSTARCSPLIDSYIAHVETNRFFIDDPLQPLYTSALYYLFQDAAVKTVKVSHNITTGIEALELSVVGTTSLKGDLEKHVIKFSIPLASLISTAAGMLFLLLLVVLVLVSPTERLKMSEDTNVAVRYAELLQNDEYPAQVFDRALLLPSGDRVAMDEYVVESTTIHFTRDTAKKVYL